MCVRKLNLNLKQACAKFSKVLRWTLDFLYKFWLSGFHLKSGLKCVNVQSGYTGSNELRIERIMPEAKGWPIFGTLFDLLAAGGARQLHNYIDKRHREFGSIFCERLGGSSQAYVFVSSASQMRSVFLFEGQFPRHPLPEAWTLYNELYQCKRGLFFMENVDWLHNRRILSRFLLNGNLNWIDAHIESATMKLINEWKTNAPGKGASEDFFAVPLLEQRLYRWAIDVICTIMFGQSVVDYPEVDQLLEEFSKIVHSVFETSIALMDFPPKIAKFLNLRIWENFEQNVTNVLDMGSKVIDKFVDLLKDNNVSDEFTKTLENASLFQKLQESQMSMSLIKRIFVDLVIAAGDTTAYTTIWALVLLTQNEHLQRQILDNVINYGDESPLITGLIRETLRLYPVAPFIGRFLNTDAVIDNYYIEKDTLVLLSLFTAGRDPKHFPDPLKIKPDRWQRTEPSGKYAQVLEVHGSMPFAIGNRSCIGRKIAMKQMSSILTALIVNFDMKCGNYEPFEPILRLVTVPNQTLKLLIKCH